MSNSVGIYIHIPFCRSKCPYCDFFSMRGNKDDYISYVNILKDKIAYWGNKTDKKVDTIYIGGGTPSVIGADLIYDILKCIKCYFKVSESAEITIEANPSSAKSLDFEYLHSIGLNRVSLGVQSANPNELKKLGRLHTNEDVLNTINLIKNSGINNISLDIMLGIPEQTIENLKNSLDFCINADITHISSYILKLEENTFFYKNKDKIEFPDDNLTSELYFFAVDYLEKNGFNQYEISNFTKLGYESKHNLKYWNLEEYIGIGPAAHSFLNSKRFYYERSIEGFKNNEIIYDCLGGTKDEYIMLKLRLKSGINLNEYKKVFGENVSKDFLKKIDFYSKLGYLDIKENNISLTGKGFLLSNTIISDLI